MLHTKIKKMTKKEHPFNESMNAIEELVVMMAEHFISNYNSRNALTPKQVCVYLQAIIKLFIKCIHVTDETVSIVKYVLIIKHYLKYNKVEPIDDAVNACDELCNFVNAQLQSVHIAPKIEVTYDKTIEPTRHLLIVESTDSVDPLIKLDRNVIYENIRDNVDVIYTDAATLHLLSEQIANFNRKWISINTMMHNYETADDTTICVFGQQCSVTRELSKYDPNTKNMTRLLRTIAAYTDALYIYNCSVGNNNYMKELFYKIQEETSIKNGIFASTNLTGSNVNGGDWYIEWGTLTGFIKQDDVYYNDVINHYLFLFKSVEQFEFVLGIWEDIAKAFKKVGDEFNKLDKKLGISKTLGPVFKKAGEFVSRQVKDLYSMLPKEVKKYLEDNTDVLKFTSMLTAITMLGSQIFTNSIMVNLTSTIASASINKLIDECFKLVGVKVRRGGRGNLTKIYTDILTGTPQAIFSEFPALAYYLTIEQTYIQGLTLQQAYIKLKPDVPPELNSLIGDVEDIFS
jgi:hypothetical protein